MQDNGHLKKFILYILGASALSRDEIISEIKGHYDPTIQDGAILDALLELTEKDKAIAHYPITDQYKLLINKPF